MFQSEGADNLFNINECGRITFDGIACENKSFEDVVFDIFSEGKKGD